MQRLSPFIYRSRSKSDDDVDEFNESKERRRKGLFLPYFASGWPLYIVIICFPIFSPAVALNC